MNGARILRERAARNRGMTVQRSTPLLPVPGLYEHTTPAFRAKLVRIGRELGVDPNYLAGIISIESNRTFDPATLNPITKAHGGLIGFAKDTAKLLGTTLDDLRAMNPVAHLDYVKAFYDRFPVKGKAHLLNTPTRLYMATFMPEHVYKPGDFVIATPGSKIYDQNPGLDANRDGKLTPDDVGSILINVLDAARRKAASQPAPKAIGDHPMAHNGAHTLRQRAMRAVSPTHSAGAMITTSGFIVMPGDVLEYMNTVNRQVGDTQTDVSKSPPNDPAILQGWTTFINSWSEFYKDHTEGMFGGWTTRLTGESYDTTEKYQKELLNWRETLKGSKVVLSTPNPVLPPQPEPIVSPGIKKALIWTGAGLVVVAVGAAIVSVAKKSKSDD